jgi:methionyl-tRNA formyltransferase
MIPYILKNHPHPRPQSGKVVMFKRRKAEDGDISSLKDIQKIYDYIRMLDAPGYPPAFLNKRRIHLEFFKAKIKNNKLLAQVGIEVIGDEASNDFSRGRSSG